MTRVQAPAGAHNPSSPGATPGPATNPLEQPELGRLLLRAHQLLGRALQSAARIREEDVEVLADAAAGLGSALDALLPPLRVAARMEETLQRFEAFKGRRRAREDHPAEV